MKQFKKVLVAIIAFVVLGSSSIAYSWWDNLEIANIQNNIINLGQGLELVVLPVTIDSSTSGNLVPQSAILVQGATHAIELNYTIQFQSNVSDNLNLSVTVHDIKVNNVENPFNLISVIAYYDEIIANNDVGVTLVVTIDDSQLEEENYNAAYDLLANNNISFNVHFLVTKLV